MKTGIKGITLNSRNKKFYVAKYKVYIGQFETFEEAKKALNAFLDDVYGI